MDRSHGSHRRCAALLIAAIALVAIALIPRGVVRTTLAVADRDPSTAASATKAETPTVDDATDDRSELPGVRALVAREERDAALHDAAGAGAGFVDSDEAAAQPAGYPEVGRDRAASPVQSAPAGPTDPRAPPVLS